MLGIDDGGTELVRLDHVSYKHMVVEDVVLQLYTVGLEEGIDFLAGHGCDGDRFAVWTYFLHERYGVVAERLRKVVAVLGKVGAKATGKNIELTEVLHCFLILRVRPHQRHKIPHNRSQLCDTVLQA